MKDNHFNLTFWFIVGCTCFVFGYTVAITFIPIPKDNVRFADVAQGFLLGSVLGAGLAYLVGGNPIHTKKLPEPGTTTANITAEITTDNSKPDAEENNL